MGLAKRGIARMGARSSQAMQATEVSSALPILPTQCTEEALTPSIASTPTFSRFSKLLEKDAPDGEMLRQRRTSQPPSQGPSASASWTVMRYPYDSMRSPKSYAQAM